MLGLPLLVLAKIDFGSLALIFVFIVLPIIQSVLSSKKKKKQQEGQEPRPSRPRTRPVPRPTAQTPASTPPTTIDEPETGEAMWKQLLEGMGFEEEVMTQAPEPEPEPVPVPVATAAQHTQETHESTRADLPSEALATRERRAEEHAQADLEVDLPSAERLTERFAKLGSLGRSVIAPGAAAAPDLVLPAGELDWRRAIVLSEILGPPVCERAPGGHGAPPGLTR